MKFTELLRIELTWNWRPDGRPYIIHGVLKLDYYKYLYQAVK